MDSVEIIHGSGEHLLSVINDILDFSKVEAGMIELDEQIFDLRRTVEEALEMVSVKAAQKNLDLVSEFAADTPEMVKGDRWRVSQILVNYLSNAVKFTELGEVVVSVSATRLDARRHLLQVAVRDTGIGVPADRFDRLFQTFSQVDASTTRHYGGSGLGLAISKRLAERMGGGVAVESHPGLGSIFFLHLRRRNRPGLARGAATGQHDPHRQAPADRRRQSRQPAHPARHGAGVGHATDRHRLPARGAGDDRARRGRSTSVRWISRCRRWTATSSPRRFADSTAMRNCPCCC